MKRIGNLYQSIITTSNLLVASRKAQRGKRHYTEVQEWNKNLWYNIYELQKELINKTYEVSDYFIFTIHEPKERIISKLPFRDRVVHHAIINILEPIFQKSFISQTYSCIKSRGVHKCLRDLNKALEEREATKYCLKMDVAKFYPSVDNEILKEKLTRKFKDPDLLWLLGKIIDSCQGLPLGNFTSQWLGNFYLSEFDRFLKQEKKVTYFRYLDDFVILHPDKTYLYNLKLEIRGYLQERLKLTLSNHQVFPVAKRGIDFCGYVSTHDYIHIRKRIKQSFKRKKNKLSSLPSYLGWTQHGDCRNLERKILLT